MRYINSQPGALYVWVEGGPPEDAAVLDELIKVDGVQVASAPRSARGREVLAGMLRSASRVLVQERSTRGVFALRTAPSWRLGYQTAVAARGL